MKKIWHISDSHTLHEQLIVPEGIDIVVFSGDCSNPKDPYINEPEVRAFINWFKGLPILIKIFVPGNHDTSIEKGLITRADFEAYNIVYLENDYFEVDGIKFFGSPNVPSYGNWSFMKARGNMHEHWSKVDEYVDVFICHGPPKGIMDLATKKEGHLEQCGDESLRKHILGRLKPKFLLSGHIHNNDGIINAGVLKLSEHNTVFSNGSVVTDKVFGRITSNGNILYYE